MVTPILIRNDYLHEIEKDPVRTARRISDAARDCGREDEHGMVSVGYDHADMPRLLVVLGNTMLDVSRVYTTSDIRCRHENYTRECIAFLRAEARRLGKIIREMEGEKD